MRGAVMVVTMKADTVVNSCTGTISLVYEGLSFKKIWQLISSMFFDGNVYYWLWHFRFLYGFVLWTGCDTQSLCAENYLFYFMFFFLSAHIQPTCRVNQKAI